MSDDAVHVGALSQLAITESDALEGPLLEITGTDGSATVELTDREAVSHLARTTVELQAAFDDDGDADDE